jgi:autotransporter-associated beta strand protein
MGCGFDALIKANPNHSKTMKPRLSARRLLSSAVILLTLTPALHAADLYWDVNNDTSGSGNAGGTWDTATTANWSTLADGTAVTGTFQDGDAAIFSAGADGTGSWTVNVSGSVQPASITFKENGTKTLSGGEISVALSPVISSAGRGNGFNYNIDSKLTGTGSITLAANGATSFTGDGIGGNITLSNNTNDFTGDITITSGVVNFASDAVFGNTANDIIIAGGGLVATGNRTLPSTRDIILSGGGDRIFRGYGGVTFTVQGAITGTGNVVHTDGGTLVLAGSNSWTGNLVSAAGSGRVVALAAPQTYTGFTHVRETSTLRLDADNVLPDGAYNVFWGGTTFNINGRTDTTGALTTGSAGDTNVVMNLGSGGNLTISNNNLVAGTFGGYTNATWDGRITGTGNITYAHATATGGAVQWDVRNANNDFTGNWTIRNGRFRFQPNTLADASLGNVENDIIFDGDVVESLNNQGGLASIQVTNGQSVTHPATRTFTLNTGKEGTFYVWGGTTQTINGLITGGGNLRKEDSGTLVLTNTANDYTGLTRIAAGTLRPATTGVIPDASTLELAGGNFDTAAINETVASLIGSGGNVNGSGTLTVLTSGSATYQGTISASTILNMAGTGTQTLAGTADNSSGWARASSGTLILAKASSPTVHAIGASHVVGLTVDPGATVQLGGSGDDQIYLQTRVTLNGTFDLNGKNEGFQALFGTGTVTNSVTDSFSALTLGQDPSTTGTDFTFPGTIEDGIGTVDLRKEGNGTIRLSNNHTYTGFTDVIAGTLAIDGSLGNSITRISDGATLAGNGALGSDVQVYTGGGLGTRITDWTGTPGTGFTDLTIAGQIQLDGTSHTIRVDLTGVTNFTDAPASFPIATATGGITGFNAADFTVIPTGFSGNGNWAASVTGNILSIVYTLPAGYDSWADDNAPGQTIDMDHDGDGVPNGIEYFMGLSGNAFTANPTPNAAGTISWPIGAEYDGIYGTDYVIETSDDLAEGNWQPVLESDPNLTISPSSIDYTLPTGEVKVFARLKVTGP